MTKLVTLSAAIEKQLYITLKKSRNFVEKTSVTLQKLIIKDEMDLMNYKLPNRIVWKNHWAKQKNSFYSWIPNFSGFLKCLFWDSNTFASMCTWENSCVIQLYVVKSASARDLSGLLQSKVSNITKADN